MAVQESNAQAVGRPMPSTKAHWLMKSFAGPPFAKSSSMRALLATSNGSSITSHCSLQLYLTTVITTDDKNKAHYYLVLIHTTSA
ncbi:Uncharacterized protein DBV15_08216 [Temnothorax longispinosus]|uniref:Uncharacterized protein n=1 Tax=Temnothorax longispinosus TaxID=300112 RepID=A0A4S2KQ28_9HYME|nr:Uncharacterized protein DBV15_08216 [Temnothorax longispinosus]